MLEDMGALQIGILGPGDVVEIGAARVVVVRADGTREVFTVEAADFPTSEVTVEWWEY